MHDIWNPWHGCTKYSEGCAHCYMYYLDKTRNRDGSQIARSKTGFRYPLQKKRDGTFRIESGELIRVCMTSDFFLEEADAWREEAWEIMRQRPDVKFFLITKRPERILSCLPEEWGNGWENIMLNVTCENQERADERLPLLLSLPFKHKGVMCTPLLGPVSLEPYLSEGHIEQVICGGENYDGARPCHFEWVEALYGQCEKHDITFNFIETGNVFVKDGKTYHLKNKRIQSVMAYKSNRSRQGKKIIWKLTDPLGLPVPDDQLYVPKYKARCSMCAAKLTCNGCHECGCCSDA